MATSLSQSGTRWARSGAVHHHHWIGACDICGHTPRANIIIIIIAIVRCGVMIGGVLETPGGRMALSCVDSDSSV